MPDFYLAEATPAATWAVPALHQLERQSSIEIHGEDTAGSLTGRQMSASDSPAAVRGLVFAVPGRAPTDAPTGRFGLPALASAPQSVWGSISWELPLLDNLHLLDDATVHVAAPHRRSGIGTALVAFLERTAREQGRDTILLWTQHRPPTPEQAQVSAVTGNGSVPLDALTAFARSQGFSLAQVEHQSRLRLPLEPGRLSALHAQAAAQAEPTYHLQSWMGPTPQRYLDAVAKAHHALSTDAPNGEIQWEAEAWDAQRVRENDQRLGSAGIAFTTIALDAADQIAALTTLFVETGPQPRARQFNTVVLSAHRGHRLGLWTKAANLAQVTAEFRELAHIETWNANENQHMLAINHQLGYRLWSVGGGWQRRLS